MPATSSRRSRTRPGWDPVDRREFMRLMGASSALAGLTACTRQPIEKIVPYVKPPEEGLPGQSLFYATSFTLGGYALGVLAESHVGRPTKIEGNPEHPASLGATDVFAQASVLRALRSRPLPGRPQRRPPEQLGDVRGGDRPGCSRSTGPPGATGSGC